jgi:basic membrane protein A and related proteins
MRRLAPLALVLLVLVLAGGCGGDSGTDEAPPTGELETVGAETRPRTGATIRVGLVTDVGGLDDRSFNVLASRGLERAREELGVEGRVVVSRTSSDYVPNLAGLAQGGHDLVVAVGLLMADALETVAGRFPETSFAIVDVSQEAMKTRPANVRGLLFAEQEAGYLAGYLAGLVVEENGGANPTVSSVGGRKVPRVDRYIAGFRAGARAASPRVTTLNAYSQDFVDQAKCKELALNQISRGSTVVFQVAGQCGLGALNAAEEQNVDGIGVDADQSYLGDHILTSALKKVDVAVYQTVQEVLEGSFAGGGDSVFDVASGGVGIGQVAAGVSGDVLTRVNGVQQRIASGRLSGIPSRVP